MNENDQNENNKSKCRKDLWDKLSSSSKFIGALAGILASVLIPYFIHSGAEKNRKTQMYAEIMSKREKADTALRAEMFKTLLEKYLGDISEQDEKDSKPNDHNRNDFDDSNHQDKKYNEIKEEEFKTFERKITLLDLLTNNFQEYFNAKPIFERLYQRLKKEEDEVIKKLTLLVNDSENKVAQIEGWEGIISELKKADIGTLQTLIGLLPFDGQESHKEIEKVYEKRLENKRIELEIPLLELKLALARKLLKDRNDFLKFEKKIANLKIERLSEAKKELVFALKKLREKLKKRRKELKSPDENPKKENLFKKEREKELNSIIEALEKKIDGLLEKHFSEYNETERDFVQFVTDFVNSIDHLDKFDQKRKELNQALSEGLKVINENQKMIIGSQGKKKSKKNNKEVAEKTEKNVTKDEDLLDLNRKIDDLFKDKNYEQEDVEILDVVIRKIFWLYKNLEDYSDIVLNILVEACSDQERKNLLSDIESTIDNVNEEVEKFIISDRNIYALKDLQTNIERYLSKITVSFAHKYRQLMTIKAGFKKLQDIEGSVVPSINELKRIIEKIMNRKKLRYRLINLARATASRQVTMLTRVGTIRTISLHRNYKDQCLIRLYDTEGLKYKNGVDLKPFTYSIDGIQTYYSKFDSGKARYHSVWLEITDLQEDSLGVAVKVFRDHFKKDFLKKYSYYQYSDLVETEAINFGVSYFDMPYMDNTRLYDGSRFAIVLKDLNPENGYALIQVASFREEFMSIRDRPLFEEMLMKIKEK